VSFVQKRKWRVLFDTGQPRGTRWDPPQLRSEYVEAHHIRGAVELADEKGQEHGWRLCAVVEVQREEAR